MAGEGTVGEGERVTRVLGGILVGVVVGGALAWTILRHDHGGDDEAPEAKTEASRADHDDARSVVKLATLAQQHAGLETAPLQAADLQPEVKAYGRVLDPAPLAAQVVELATARAALEASTKEFNRLKVLHAPDQSVSTRALEGADAAMTHDRIALDAAQLKLVAAWGKAIAEQPDLPAFVRALAALETALVRVDVPPGTALAAPPTGARLATLTAPDAPVDAQFLGPAVAVDPQTQGQGFLFLLRGNPFRPGAAVVAWLGLPGEEEKGVIVPRSAVVRHEGEAFIYVQSSAEDFERRNIELAHPTGPGWFVPDAARAGERVVVVGAQELLSEELKGRGGEEE